MSGAFVRASLIVDLSEHVHLAKIRNGGMAGGK